MEIRRIYVTPSEGLAKLKAKNVSPAVFTVQVPEDGRVTIPKDVREAYGIVDGDYVTFMYVENHGKLNTVPKKVESQK